MGRISLASTTRSYVDNWHSRSTRPYKYKLCLSGSVLLANDQDMFSKASDITYKKKTKVMAHGGGRNNASVTSWMTRMSDYCSCKLILSDSGFPSTQRLLSVRLIPCTFWTISSCLRCLAECESSFWSQPKHLLEAAHDQLEALMV